MWLTLSAPGKPFLLLPTASWGVQGATPSPSAWIWGGCLSPEFPPETPPCPGSPWQRDSSAWHWCLLCPRRSHCWGCFPRGSDVRGLLAMLMGC